MANAVRAATAMFDVVHAELTAAIAEPAATDATIRHVEELVDKLTKAAAEIDATAASVAAAAKATADVAGASPSQAAVELVTKASRLARAVRTSASDARHRADDARRKAGAYVAAETQDPQILIARAGVEIKKRSLVDAKRDLDRARTLIQRSGARSASLDFEYARLYDESALETRDPVPKRSYWQQAERLYQLFVSEGAGPHVEQARLRAAEIAIQLKKLETR